MDSIYYGSMHGASESAPMRIGFTSIPDVVAEGSKRKQRLAQAREGLSALLKSIHRNSIHRAFCPRLFLSELIYRLSALVGYLAYGEEEEVLARSP